MGDGERINSGAPKPAALTVRVAKPGSAVVPDTGNTTRDANPAKISAQTGRPGAFQAVPEKGSLPEQRPKIDQVDPNANRGFIENVKDQIKQENWVSGIFYAAGEALFSDQKTNSGIAGAIKVLPGMILALVQTTIGLAEDVVSYVVGPARHINQKPDYDKAQTEFDAAQTKVDGLKDEVRQLSDKVKEKSRIASQASSAAESAAAGITPNDENGLRTVKVHEQATQEARQLAKLLEEKQEQLRAAEKLLKKAKSNLEKAGANIPEEARTLDARAKRNLSETSEILGHIDLES